MSGPLPTRMVPKPWGRDVLPGPFAAPAGERIGEIWFEPPAGLSQLLLKYIFTGEALSIQVHPSDTQARAMGLGHCGKEECWLIVDAEPGAHLGIGFKETTNAAAIRSAALDGSIEDLLEWHPVVPGDFFYIPANTVHAIGAGVSLIELQQNSDVTYRLYDYGRPRELHLEEGLAIASLTPHPSEYRLTAPAHQSARLVSGPLFQLDQVAGLVNDETARRYPGGLLVIPREGSIHVAGQEIVPGVCAFASSIADVTFHSTGVCLLASACTELLSPTHIA